MCVPGLINISFKGSFAYILNIWSSFSSIQAKLRDILPKSIKCDESFLGFKNKIKVWTLINCPCKLCKIYVANVGYLQVFRFISLHTICENTAFSLNRVLPYKDRIVDSVLIRESTGQWTPIFRIFFTVCGCKFLIFPKYLRVRGFVEINTFDMTSSYFVDWCSVNLFL